MSPPEAPLKDLLLGEGHLTEEALNEAVKNAVRVMLLSVAFLKLWKDLCDAGSINLETLVNQSLQRRRRRMT